MTANQDTANDHLLGQRLASCQGRFRPLAPETRSQTVRDLQQLGVQLLVAQASVAYCKMLRIGRCLSRLSQQAQPAAGASQASRALLERYQEATCSALNHAEPHSQRGFFTAFGLQQQSGAPMMESHGDAEEEEQRREDLNQHRGIPQDTSEVDILSTEVFYRIRSP